MDSRKVGLALLGGWIGGTLLTVAVVIGLFDGVDQSINETMIRWESAWLVDASIVLSDLGSVPVVIGVILAVFGWFVWRNGLRTGHTS